MEKLDHHKISHGIPKAELHIHIEGTLEPELVVKLSKKHNLNSTPNLDELKQKYKFTCLKDFLDLYYECCNCLIDESDFEELMYEYLKKASSQGLVYAEIFFDPQTHTKRGVSFKTVVEGLTKGIMKANKEFNVEANLIMCFLRDLSEQDAIDTFKESLAFKKHFIAVGLDSNEFNNPPEKFKNVFKMAKKEGLHLVAHAGEECSISTSYISSALDVLNVERIDHGIQIVKDEELLSRAIVEEIPLTTCPLSNVMLKVHSDIKESPIINLLKKGVVVTLNSDDPAYFGGYIGDNYYAIATAFDITIMQYRILAQNSFNASFLDKNKKEDYCESVDKFIKNTLPNFVELDLY